MKRIVIVGPAYPYRGGIADTNESLCRALINFGCEVEMVTFTMQYPSFLFPGRTQFSKDPSPNLKIQRLLNSTNPISWFLTVRAINRINPDLVIFRYWIPFIGISLGTVARFLSKTIQKIAICDNIVPHEAGMLDRAITRYFNSSCDRFVTMSSQVHHELQSLTGKPSLQLFHPINDNWGSQIPKGVAREELQLEEKDRVLLFFGLIRKYKGLDLILAALSDERLRDMDVKLMIVGEFYDSREPYDEMIEDLGLKKSVFVIDEFIPREKVGTYFGAADLITQTYHSASQSGITQIAYHFDRPILVTNVGGLSEYVPHNEVGYVVQKSPIAIADAIVDFYSNDRSDSFTRNVQYRKKEYSWERFSEQLLEFSAE